MAQLVTRYAKSFFQNVSPDKAPVLLSNLKVLESWLVESPEFSNFIKNPLKKVTEAHAVITELSKRASFDKLMLNFLLVLVENRRLALLPLILKEIFSLYDASENILKAKVFSVRPLTNGEKEIILKYLGKKFSQKIIFHEEVDSSVLGGVRINVGSLQMDGTLKTQLKQIQRQLSEV